MKKIVFLIFCVLFALTLSKQGISRKTAKNVHPADPRIENSKENTQSLDGSIEEAVHPARRIITQETRTLIEEYTFDSGPLCMSEGWTSHDLTEQTGCYWHVADATELNGGDHGRLIVLEGQQSLWCGSAPDAYDPVLCGYGCLPGYGREWDQGWCFKCIEVPINEEVYIDYEVIWDSEETYDFTYVEYATKSTCDSLLHVDMIPASDWHMIQSFDGIGGPIPHTDTIPAGHSGFIKIRFHFVSDAAWDDYDCVYDSDGAIIIDNLSVTAQYQGLYDFEDFEYNAGEGGENPGDLQTADGDWECCVLSGYGDFAGLYPGVTLLQGDPCVYNTSCMWAFINGSTENYACGGYPAQVAVPKVNERGQYIHNEIWSPPIDLTSHLPCSSIELEFDVYRDMPLENLVFYIWHVRCAEPGICPGPWKDRNFVYFNPDFCAEEYYDWATVSYPVGDLICEDCPPPPQSCCTHVQLALGVVDMAWLWAPYYGTGDCHSHAPLIDNVRLYCTNRTHPYWTVQERNLFQDAFPTDHSATGTGRADAASGSDVISVNVNPSDCNGFSTDVDRNAVYCYVSIEEPGALSGSSIQGGSDWPYYSAGDLPDECGRYWYCFHMYNDPTGSDQYTFNLNDEVFTPSHKQIFFFFGARNASSQWSYWSEFTGITYNAAGLEKAACNPMEFQILPSGESDILYIDDFDGLGAQPYFDTAFEILDINPDRYDVRNPRSCMGNTPAGAVYDIYAQLIPAYRKIIWNSGDVCRGTIGDGSSDPCSEDDFQLLYTFLDQHTNPLGAGIYISGDDIAQEWVGAPLAGYATAFKNAFCSFNLVSSTHRPWHADSPLGIGVPTGSEIPPAVGIFDHGVPAGVDTIIIHNVYDDCSFPADFDVLDPIGSSTSEMIYEDNVTHSAVIAHDTLNSYGNRAAVVLSGFSYHNIRDDRPKCSMDRVDHLADILRYLGNIVGEPTSNICLGGRIDNFNTADGDEPTTVSSEFETYLNGLAMPKLFEFDKLVINHHFGHTIYCPAAECITNLDCEFQVFLEIRIKANDGASGTDNLSFRNAADPHWGIDMDTLQAWHTGYADTDWSPGDVSTFILDLENMPRAWQGTTNILEHIRDGQMDVMVSDDSGVDYIKLTIERAGGVGIYEYPPPAKLVLHQNFPNPFNPATTIQFELPVSTPIVLSIFDITGRLITTLANDVFPAGIQRVIWNGRNAKGELVASGVYFYRLKAGSSVLTKKMLLLK